jgi:hypothetical protein
LNQEKDSPAQEDLKATSDSIRHDAQRLSDLEKAKTELDPADPRVEQMSKDIEKLIAEIADKAKAERELAEDHRSQRGHSRDEGRPN